MVLFVIGSAAFVALGFLILMHNGPIGLLAQLVAVVNIGFFGTIFVYALGFLFQTHRGLLINETGVRDTAVMVQLGTILWTDIASIQEYHVVGHQHIAVTLRDPEKYLKDLPTLKRMWLEFTAEKYGTPFFINSKPLKGTHTEVLAALQAAHKRYTGSETYEQV